MQIEIKLTHVQVFSNSKEDWGAVTFTYTLLNLCNIYFDTGKLFFKTTYFINTKSKMNIQKQTAFCPVTTHYSKNTLQSNH